MASAQVLATTAKLSKYRGRVMLHSGSNDDECGHWSFVGCRPIQTIEAWGHTIKIRDQDGTIIDQRSANPLDSLDSFVANCSRDNTQGPCPTAIGYLGYELCHQIEPRALPPKQPGNIPDMWFGRYDAVWRYDHTQQTASIVGTCRKERDFLARALNASSSAIGKAPVLGSLHCNHDPIYHRNVHKILDYIRAGDIYQANVARMLSASVDKHGDPLAIYQAIDIASPASFGALIQADDVTLISGSPERFLAMPTKGDRLETRPIKGTKARIQSSAESAAAELARHPKEQAEHLMIVDLERNDLGRIAETGSVLVDKLGYVVELPTLYHMVSRVSCQPRTDATLSQILQATFPGGSITGAPKIRAMQIIQELEPVPRGPYTGAIGYFGAGESINLSIAIRTAVLTSDELRLHVGGGIVADSTAQREFRETEEKAAAWRIALESLGQVTSIAG